MRLHVRAPQVVRRKQLELFEVEAQISELQKKRKAIKVELALAGFGTKRCAKCGEDLELDQFARDPRASDRKCSWCFECRSADNRKRYQVSKAA